MRSEEFESPPLPEANRTNPKALSQLGTNAKDGREQSAVQAFSPAKKAVIKSSSSGSCYVMQAGAIQQKVTVILRQGVGR